MIIPVLYAVMFTCHSKLITVSCRLLRAIVLNVTKEYQVDKCEITCHNASWIHGRFPKAQNVNEKKAQMDLTTFSELE